MVEQPKREDSLKKRYVYKLGTNLLSLPITLGIQAIVTRMLGPAAYGNYSFLNTFFTQIVAFFDTGLSAGFYSKLSQRQNEPGLLRFFWGIVSIVSLLVFLFVSIVFASGFAVIVWPDQQAIFIWMAVVWSLLTWCSQVINQAVDAFGLTVPGSIGQVLQKVVGLALIIVMVWLTWFNLVTFYLYQYALILFVCIVWGLVLHRNGRTLFPRARLAAGQIRSYSREFYVYSAPLIFLGLVVLVVGILDRWLLQQFSGSVQQGFYSLSYQIGVLCFLVAGAMTPLFWREIAKAFGDRDLLRMQSLFRRTIHLMYGITAFLSVFVALHAPEVSLIVGGSNFAQAALPVAIMVLYPIHQTYGQLTGSFLLGTGQTKVVRNVGVITISAGLLLSWLLMAPTTSFGLGLGATGLAIKMVVAQFASVNLQLWFISRYLRFSFWSFLLHQVLVVGCLLGLAWSSAAIVDLVVENSILALMASGIVYSAMFVGVVLLFPSLIGMPRSEITNGILWFYGMLRIRFKIPA